MQAANKPCPSFLIADSFIIRNAVPCLSPPFDLGIVNLALLDLKLCQYVTFGQQHLFLRLNSLLHFLHISLISHFVILILKASFYTYRHCCHQYGYTQYEYNPGIRFVNGIFHFTSFGFSFLCTTLTYASDTQRCDSLNEGE